MDVVTVNNEGDENGDGELSNNEAEKLWPIIAQRISSEFAHVRGEWHACCMEELKHIVEE